MATTAKKTTSKTKDSKAATSDVNKLRIRVRAYEHKILDSSVKQIIDTALRFDAQVVGPIPLPTEIKKYTVNRARLSCTRMRENNSRCARISVSSISMNPGRER
jgi:small subunit ribosomal protein S10